MTSQIKSVETPYQLHSAKKCGKSSRKCRYCHIEKELCREDLIGWKNFQLHGVKYTTLTTLLKIEARYRHKFQEKHLKQIDRAFKSKGTRSLENMILNRINKRIRVKPDNDGRQTSYLAHGIDVAMHTTAVCCRYCIEHWHGIDSRKEYVLTEKDVNYLKDVVLTYLTEFIVPKGEFRDWMSSKELDNGYFYEPDEYEIKKLVDGGGMRWISKKIGPGLGNKLTSWYAYINNLKQKYGKDVDIKEHLLNDK